LQAFLVLSLSKGEDRSMVDERAVLILFIRHSAKREGGRQAQDEDG
jgi:hypothetical protein